MGDEARFERGEGCSPGTDEETSDRRGEFVYCTYHFCGRSWSYLLVLDTLCDTRPNYLCNMVFLGNIWSERGRESLPKNVLFVPSFSFVHMFVCLFVCFGIFFFTV